MAWKSKHLRNLHCWRWNWLTVNRVKSRCLNGFCMDLDWPWVLPARIEALVPADSPPSRLHNPLSSGLKWLENVSGHCHCDSQKSRLHSLGEDSSRGCYPSLHLCDRWSHTLEYITTTSSVCRVNLDLYMCIKSSAKKLDNTKQNIGLMLGPMIVETACRDRLLSVSFWFQLTGSKPPKPYVVLSSLATSLLRLYRHLGAVQEPMFKFHALFFSICDLSYAYSFDVRTLPSSGKWLRISNILGPIIMRDAMVCIFRGFVGWPLHSFSVVSIRFQHV